MNKQLDKTTALHCRLSRDDKQDGISGSIKINSLSLEKCANDNGFNNIRVFVDDGWSGTNFTRPSLTEIIEFTEKRQIEPLIVKDHSWFGSNHLIVGQLLEEGFNELGIRLYCNSRQYRYS